MAVEIPRAASSIQKLRESVATMPQTPAEAGPVVKSRLRVVGAFLVGAIVGSIVGGGIVSNARHPAATPTPVATTEAPQAAQPDLVATGTFIQPDINDPLRRGAGKVSVSADSVVLDSDFTVTPGPDYRVILVPKPAIRATARRRPTPCMSTLDRSPPSRAASATTCRLASISPTTRAW